MRSLFPIIIVVLSFPAWRVHAQWTERIHYQGNITSAGVAFDGPGQFKFALVDEAGTRTYWSNDGTSAEGREPAAAVTVQVTAGHYQVVLGDPTLLNMVPIPADVYTNPTLFVRVWFNDGLSGSQKLVPDQPIDFSVPVSYGHVLSGNPQAAQDVWQEVVGKPGPVGTDITSVWTGSEMIVWLGTDNFVTNAGARYNPATNSWTAVNMAGGPSLRHHDTAVWTGPPSLPINRFPEGKWNSSKTSNLDSGRRCGINCKSVAM